MADFVRLAWDATRLRTVVTVTSSAPKASYWWLYRQDAPGGQWRPLVEGRAAWVPFSGYAFTTDPLPLGGPEVTYRSIFRSSVVGAGGAGGASDTSNAIHWQDDPFQPPPDPTKPAPPDAGVAAESPPADIARVRATPVLGLWTENISQAHALRTSIDVLDSKWQVVASDLPVIALDWNVDGTALEDTTGTLQVADVDAQGRSWWPSASHDPLTPFGNRVRATLTCDGVNGPVSVLLGHALISTVEMQRPDGIITVGLVDICREYAQSLLESNQPDDGTPVTDAEGAVTDYTLNSRQFYFGKMLNECRVPAPRWDGWPASVPSLEMPGTRGQWAAGTSRWEVMQRISDVDGMRLWINRDGRLSFSRSTLLTNDTAATATPVMTLSTGVGGTIHAIRTSLTRDGACNRAVVWTERNEPFSTPDVSVGGYGDTAATTPPMTWPGTIGDATYVETWPTATSSQALYDASARLLNARKGAVRGMTVDTLPMPFVDPGDVVEVRVGAASERFVVKSWRLSLPANTMTIEAAGWVTGDQATITPAAGSQESITVAAWPLEQRSTP